MAEYIDKVAFNYAIREAVKRYPNSFYNGLEVARQIAHDLPAADVRPVVYCKDCVHFIRGELFGDMVCDYHYRHHYHAEPNEFCSHAEKREER